MKFLHISDLHLGKRVNEFSMTEDQRYILSQIHSIAECEAVDAVIISGDIYDKPVPSAEAVQIFDQFLTVLADCKKRVFLISGNHDSAERIAFGAQLMSGRGVYVSPVYDGRIKPVTLTDEYGELSVYLLPFIRPAAVRRIVEKEAEQGQEQHLPESYQEAVEFVINRMQVDREKRNILAVHQFVTGARRCESEEIVVGGLDNVDMEVFDAFDYVALGHIHSPQFIGRETVRYCGTPLKYSFSEAEQEKSVTIVECREKGQTQVYTVPLHPLRDLRLIKGTYLELTARSFYQNMNTEDYIKVILTDEEDIPDGIQKLRIIYPNLMQLSYDNSRTRQDRTIAAVEAVERKSELELFEEFYQLQNNQPMSTEQKTYFTHLLEGIRSLSL